MVYKGSKNLSGYWTTDGEWKIEEGREVNVVATIKEHGVRDGVKQTIVCRPKVKGE